ncbi:putative VQ motif-containing protein/18/20/21/25 [Helianthus anomalus]
MTSSKFYDGDHKQQLKSRIVINRLRRSPLNIKQESHTIHKHHNHHHKNHQQKQIRKPVILYIHSPEIIHTKPHEFMALVQKLTGCSGSNDQQQ